MKKFQFSYVIPMPGSIVIEGLSKHDATIKFLELEFRDLQQFAKVSGDAYFCADCDVQEIN